MSSKPELENGVKLNEGSQISMCSENLQNELEIVNKSPDSSQIFMINDEQSDLLRSSHRRTKSQSVVVDDNTDITTANTTAETKLSSENNYREREGHVYWKIILFTPNIVK